MLSHFQTISKFLDDAKEGVIVFSLGGVTRGSTLTTEMRNAFMNAFFRIPQKIIWKFEDPLENVPSNVLLMKWLPQRDVLGKYLYKIWRVVFLSRSLLKKCQYTSSQVCPRLVPGLRFLYVIHVLSHNVTWSRLYSTGST